MELPLKKTQTGTEIWSKSTSVVAVNWMKEPVPKRRKAQGILTALFHFSSVTETQDRLELSPTRWSTEDEEKIEVTTGQLKIYILNWIIEKLNDWWVGLKELNDWLIHKLDDWSVNWMIDW